MYVHPLSKNEGNYRTAFELQHMQMLAEALHHGRFHTNTVEDMFARNINLLHAFRDVIRGTKSLHTVPRRSKELFEDRVTLSRRFTDTSLRKVRHALIAAEYSHFDFCQLCSPQIIDILSDLLVACETSGVDEITTYISSNPRFFCHDRHEFPIRIGRCCFSNNLSKIVEHEGSTPIPVSQLKQYVVWTHTHEVTPATLAFKHIETVPTYRVEPDDAGHYDITRLVYEESIEYDEVTLGRFALFCKNEQGVSFDLGLQLVTNTLNTPYTWLDQLVIFGGTLFKLKYSNKPYVLVRDYQYTSEFGTYLLPLLNLPMLVYLHEALFPILTKHPPTSTPT